MVEIVKLTKDTEAGMGRREETEHPEVAVRIKNAAMLSVGM